MKRRLLLLLLILIAAVSLISILVARYAVRASLERLILERAANRLSIIVWGFGATSTDVDVYSYVEFDDEMLTIKKGDVPVFQYGTARIDPESPAIRKLERRSGSYDFALYVDFEAEFGRYAGPIRLAILVPAAVYAALFALFGWGFVGMVADPIARLASAMDAITSRNLRVRIPVPRRDDEIRRLIVTFNAMLDEIAGTYERQADFVEDMTHDIVTPVQILEGYRQIVERHGKRADLVEEYLEVSREQLARLKDMASSLKSALAAERRRRVERADATAITDRNVAAYRVLYPDLAFEASIEPGVDLPIDPSDLERIEGILLDNAVKYGREGRRVEVRLAPGELEVRDHGIGISEEDREAIFERYRRGRGADHRGEGSGLGLAILKDFSEEYGFAIDLRSRPGEGSSFTLRFPSPAGPR